MTQLYIAYSGETQVIDPGDVCTFGRSRHCTIRLDPDDLTVARVAGALLFEGGHWLLRHHDGQRGSSGPPLYLIDDRGNRNVLQDGRLHVLDRDMTILVQGQLRDHMLAVWMTRPLDLPVGPEPDADEDPTRWPDPTRLSTNDRLALAALFAEYLDPRVAEPARLPFADAAKLLGWGERAIARRVERIMERLDGAGVGGMAGPTRLETLRQYVIPRVIVPADLQLLKARLRREAHERSDPDE